MVWSWNGVWVNGIPRNSEDPRICNDLKDHFSSNRQPRCEQIYINCGLLSKDISRTLRSRRCSTSKTNTVDRHAAGRSPHWVVRVVAGIENKKTTHQRFRITCGQRKSGFYILRRTHTANRSTVSFNVRG